PRWSKPWRRTFSSYQRAVSSGGKELMFLGRALAQDLRGARAAVEEHVQGGQALDEGCRTALRVDRMRELLPDHAHAGGVERLLVEVLARAAHAAMERGGADLLADVEQELGALALHGEGRAAHERRGDLQLLAQEIERRHI